ncbi:Fasciclin-like arabinogalactan protein 2 [Hibiscus syriacus]|uniref:Fasciclin-like arabinogalactan protein 2 n=1 Tax=Hibiscus syriacus TaxID=106335 RepID=A0A6A3A8Z5_HIBSY|nr:Fasciclin-like arabinogalactan protein 2 [Hibiscus syriacus]
MLPPHFHSTTLSSTMSPPPTTLFSYSLSLLLLLLSSSSTPANAHNHSHPRPIPTILHLQPLPHRHSPGFTDQPTPNHNRPRPRQHRHVVSPVSTFLPLHPQERSVPSRPRRLLRLQEASPYFQRNNVDFHHVSGHRSCPGTSGYVNITNLKGGKVGLGAEDNNGKLDATYVKSVKEIPYNISVLQISHALDSAEAEAPTAAPSELNLMEIMSKQGCKAFADLLKATTADETFNQNIDAESDSAKEKVFVVVPWIPVYMNMQMLKTNAGILNTLATDGANKFDFTVDKAAEVVTLDTTVVTAKITGIVKDEEPLVVYKINKVLLPKEVFKPAEPHQVGRVQMNGQTASRLMLRI